MKKSALWLGLIALSATICAAEESAGPGASAPPTLDMVGDRFTDFLTRCHDWTAAHSTLLLLSLAGVLLSYLAARVLQRICAGLIARFLHKEEGASVHEELLEAFRKPLIWLFFLGGALLSLQKLAAAVSTGTAWLLFKLGGIAATLLVVWLIFRLLGVGAKRIVERQTGDRSMNVLLAGLLSKIAKIVIVILAFFFIGQNILGINITALLAGAGVAGLAVALAAQDTLANFFGSIMILVDKPFTVGDFIRFGSVVGTVESVGFRSTRVRSLDGALFQVPNRQVTDAALENVSRRPDIRYNFELGLIYQTTAEQMEQALALLREIIAAQPGIDTAKRPPLINFTDFKDWSLNISVVLWFNTAKLAEAQVWKTQLNLEILRRFNAAGLSFAYPTSTQFLTADSAFPVAVADQNKNGQN